MALNIKDPDTDRLARELAAATGESITVAARVALEERLARVRARTNASLQAADLDAIIERGRARKVIDARSANEILGYDEHGLPA
ncbi:type II toxin-antitoxin system VapB family antitoxin [Gryllotalpicola protaetiae]|uniref:PSK operon transcription factor n=1 Tax=Gryllotalpicola protaetiae TaxID=2419771 RepID=A0A387BQJ1_9MICO|nr:type II toxin-antitoxin system VapB family antitoxin [Gryllotalpicola protaetiae]AYG04812.1 PSK operon transcription factor [Gryllotalpicola protaetiae]